MKEDELFDQQLREAFKGAEDVSFSSDFSDKVFLKIEQRKNQEFRKLSWIYAAVIGFFLITAGICLVLMADSGSYSEIVNHSSYVVLVAVLLITFQILDRKMIRKTANPL